MQQMECLLSGEYFQTEPTEDLTSVILYCPPAEKHCVWESGTLSTHLSELL